jgi:hypothetical protein
MIAMLMKLPTIAPAIADVGTLDLYRGSIISLCIHCIGQKEINLEEPALTTEVPFGDGVGPISKVVDLPLIELAPRVVEPPVLVEVELLVGEGGDVAVGSDTISVVTMSPSLVVIRNWMTGQAAGPETTISSG